MSSVVSMWWTIGFGIRITTGSGRVVSCTAVPLRLVRTRLATRATTRTSSVNWTRTDFIFGLCRGVEPAEFAAVSVVVPEPPVLTASWLRLNTAATARRP
ncbi:hypothetical protein ACWEO4_36020 [Streptomyces sp. NPDC004393]|uniref:hypothetical protein n=1 Tax=Streptomyces sp. NPDC004533 TaxID=3154278 RepID=UPI0033BAB19F